MKHLTLIACLVVGLYLYSTLILLSSNAQPHSGSGSNTIIIDPLTDLPELSRDRKYKLKEAIRSARNDNPSPRRFLFALWHVFRPELSDRNDDLGAVAVELVEMMAQIDCIFFNASGSTTNGFNPKNGEHQAVLSSALVQLALGWNDQFGSVNNLNHQGPLAGYYRNRAFHTHEHLLWSLMRYANAQLPLQHGQALWEGRLRELFQPYRGMTEVQRARYLADIAARPGGRMPRYTYAQELALLSVGRLIAEPVRGELKRRVDQLLRPQWDAQWDTWPGMYQAQWAIYYAIRTPAAD